MENNGFVTKPRIAYDAIKAGIQEGIYPPGTRLIINKIANSLSISGIPVREALKTLEAEGVVVNTPHVGFQVAVPSFQRSLEVFAVLALLEGEATRLAAGHIPPQTLDELRLLLDELDATGSDYIKASALNRKFHQTIHSFCGNDYLLEVLNQVSARTVLAQYIYVLFPDRVREANLEHRAILEALTRKDGVKACKLLRAHKKKAYAKLMEFAKTATPESLKKLSAVP